LFHIAFVFDTLDALPGVSVQTIPDFRKRKPCRKTATGVLRRRLKARNREILKFWPAPPERDLQDRILAGRSL